jgi:hypothetical protein
LVKSALSFMAVVPHPWFRIAGPLDRAKHGPDDGYGIEDARTTAIKPNEQSAVDPTRL